MLWVALLLGVVEGLTEFLPVSSTGHLIVVSSLVGFEGRRAELFQIFIQLGAILAVVWEFRSRLTRVARELPRSVEARRFTLRLGVAFLPSAVLGLLVHDALLQHLFRPATVAAAPVAGALLIFVVEALPLRVRTHEESGTTPWRTWAPSPTANRASPVSTTTPPDS